MSTPHLAFTELCRIVRPLSERPALEQIETLKYELLVALERVYDFQDRASLLEAFVAGRNPTLPLPLPARPAAAATPGAALHAMRKTVGVMLERCAHLQATCDDVVRVLVALEDQPAPPPFLPSLSERC
jgi:hypothetical protein